MSKAWKRFHLKKSNWNFGQSSSITFQQCHELMPIWWISIKLFWVSFFRTCATSSKTHNLWQSVSQQHLFHVSKPIANHGFTVLKCFSPSVMQDMWVWPGGIKWTENILWEVGVWSCMVERGNTNVLDIATHIYHLQNSPIIINPKKRMTKLGTGITPLHALAFLSRSGGSMEMGRWVLMNRGEGRLSTC